ncbi:uncharacterized protein LOC114869498 isoform X2 [Betta splendens]|uniref:Uncharacterized protein LOC114869498 isoform X2 n=1 Tax=Betta splendens TaxID=158456 RepID=A0A9W2X931_BETSP|nr:uncharacterized protein LOC114869498 isoform X2 [Betta splendens]
MSCIPANSSVSGILTQVESQMETPIERKDSLSAYQIFPEANMDKDSNNTSYSGEFLCRRERLPSIVVEPSEHTDLRSGPHNPISNNVDKKDNISTENAEISLDGEQQDMAMKGNMFARKSSIGPSQGQLSISLLSPPPSPTHPEAAPPCLQNTICMD